MKYRIIIGQDEDGIFVAECTSLPGCLSQGKTRKEALINIKDATKGYLKSLKKHHEISGVFDTPTSHLRICAIVCVMCKFC